MGLHRKQRSLRVQMPEVIGVMLLAVTILAGLNWYAEQRQAPTWVRTTATVAAASRPSAPSTDDEGTRTSYTYTVNGVVYAGSADPANESAEPASTLRMTIVRVLRKTGLFSMEDLPEEAQHVLRNGSNRRLEELPEDTRAVVEELGFESVEEVRQVVLGAMETEESTLPPVEKEIDVKVEYDPAAISLAGLDAATEPEDASASTPTTENLRNPRAAVSTNVIPILYDPRNPARNALPEPALQSTQSTLQFIGFLGGAIVTCAYFGLAYPWLKRRGF